MRGRCRSCVRHGRPSIIALTRDSFCRKAIDHALRGWRASRHTQAMTLWFEDALSAVRSLKRHWRHPHLHEGRGVGCINPRPAGNSVGMCSGGEISADVPSFMG
ncbi:hypothetical protein KCP70_20280 [Salmonella enterica subsp. enterica]|nr:hypothetical protein KCP70_20280 [Salmonella enterica subsp. enterica]